MRRARESGGGRRLKNLQADRAAAAGLESPGAGDRPDGPCAVPERAFRHVHSAVCAALYAQSTYTRPPGVEISLYDDHLPPTSLIR